VIQDYTLTVFASRSVTVGLRSTRLLLRLKTSWTPNITCIPIRRVTNRLVRFTIYAAQISHALLISMIGCESYSVPDHVHEHVELIKPTVHFVHHIPDDPALLRKRSNLGLPTSKNGPKTKGVIVTASDILDLASCDRFTTPECLRVLYQMNYEPQRVDSNSFGIGVFSASTWFSAYFDIIQSSLLHRRIFQVTWTCSSGRHHSFNSLRSRPDFPPSNFSPSQVGKRPTLVSIDGGRWSRMS
jgi:tripeptidyl-peptidase I